MLQKASGDTTPSSLEQIFASVSKELYPRLALFEALARFKDKHERRAPCNDDIVEARRAFLDSFAYLCDVQKGGATVTAAGLQQLPHSNILWLAANEGIRSDIKTYADTILSKLWTVDPSNQNDVEDDIFQLAVEKCRSRIVLYKDKMQNHARNCRMQLRNETQNESGEISSLSTNMQHILTCKVALLRRRLKKLSEPPPSMTLTDIIDFCYGMRGPHIGEIKRRSKDPLDDFDKLAHFIGRLGATRSSVHAVIKGIIKVPALPQISCIRTVEAPDIRKVTLDQWALSPYEILRGICQDRVSQNPLQNGIALHTLVELDLPSGSGEMRSKLASRNSIVTRVHAELQIADKFSRHLFMEFVDDDKYIGCSKPACYFCFNWLSNHKHGYVLPATHYRIIPGCRGPDSGVNESGVGILKDMYAKIGTRLGQDILDYLLTLGSGHAHPRYQYQSTEGSSRA